ncbi:MAG: hypothetical protein KGJ90_02520 [Patescibacteria group bacterium]|nr:hypothetical protein [Patescibacteria group bacterium]
MKLYDGSADCCYVCGWDYTKAHQTEEVHTEPHRFEGIGSILDVVFEAAFSAIEIIERLTKKEKL